MRLVSERFALEEATFIRLSLETTIPSVSGCRGSFGELRDEDDGDTSAVGLPNVCELGVCAMTELIRCFGSGAGRGEGEGRGSRLS